MNHDKKINFGGRYPGLGGQGPLRGVDMGTRQGVKKLLRLSGLLLLA